MTEKTKVDIAAYTFAFVVIGGALLFMQSRKAPPASNPLDDIKVQVQDRGWKAPMFCVCRDCRRQSEPCATILQT